MGWTEPWTWTPNEPITASKLNTLTQAIKELQAAGAGLCWMGFYRSGRWYPSVPLSSGQSYITLPGNILVALPFFTPVSSTWDQIGLTYTGNPAHARYGVYRDNGQVYPGELILDTGEIEMPNYAGISLTLSPGLYWLAVLSDVTLYGVQGMERGHGYAPIGSETPGAHPRNCWWTLYNYGPLPDPFPEEALDERIPHFLFLRKA